jgi:hypothetical protein
MFQISRRAVVAAGAAAVLLVATAACSTGGGTSTSTSTASATASAAPAGSATPQITAAANAFLATLDDSAKDAVSFDWTDTEQKQRWSNFPAALYERAGLRWGDLTETQQNAWLAIMQKSLSAEGYDRVMAEWDADEALATQTGQTDQYGKQYYYLALIGTPSDDCPWMWQWGGHHVTVNATVASGVVSVTPSFTATSRRPTPPRTATRCARSGTSRTRRSRWSTPSTTPRSRRRCSETPRSTSYSARGRTARRSRARGSSSRR